MFWLITRDLVSDYFANYQISQKKMTDLNCGLDSNSTYVLRWICNIFIIKARKYLIIYETFAAAKNVLLWCEPFFTRGVWLMYGFKKTL